MHSKWSYSTGRKGLNRCRAFKQGGRYYCEYMQSGKRIREPVEPRTRRAARLAAELKAADPEDWRTLLTEAD